MDPASSAEHSSLPIEIDESLPGPLGCKYDDSLSELKIQLVVPGIKEKTFTHAANTDVYIKTDSESLTLLLTIFKLNKKVRPAEKVTIDKRLYQVKKFPGKVLSIDYKLKKDQVVLKPRYARPMSAQSEALLQRYLTVRGYNDKSGSDDLHCPLPLEKQFFDKLRLYTEYCKFTDHFPQFTAILLTYLRAHFKEDHIVEADARIQQLSEDVSQQDWIDTFEMWDDVSEFADEHCHELKPFLAEITSVPQSSPKAESPTKVESPPKSESPTKAESPTDEKPDEKPIEEKTPIRVRFLDASTHVTLNRVTCAAVDPNHFVLGTSCGTIVRVAVPETQPLPVGSARRAPIIVLKSDPEQDGSLLSGPEIWESTRLHGSKITSIASLGNSGCYSSADVNGRIVLWTVSPTEPFNYRSKTWQQHLGPVWQVACDQSLDSPEEIISAQNDFTARLWRSESDSCLRVFPHSRPVETVAMRSRLVATSCAEELGIRIWDVNSTKVSRILTGLDSECYKTAFIDEGRLAAVTEHGTLYVFDLAEGRILWRTLNCFGVGELPTALSACLRENKEFIALGGSKGTVRLRNSRLATELTGPILALHLDEDGIIGVGKGERFGRVL